MSRRLLIHSIMLVLIFTSANVLAFWSKTDSKEQAIEAQQVSSQLPDFVRLAKHYAPAVVNIEVINTQELDGSSPNLDRQNIPDIFKHFFGNPTPHKRKKTPPKSFGSGFVIDEDGYIVTNYHVVAEAKSIVVRFQDRQELEAKVVGNDQLSDISLLKVNSKEKLPYLKFAASDALQVGQWVAAIGAPFGFDYSITKGVVSATGRSLTGDSYVPFIQTDVPINPGNSGGPLLNLSGEVVGINAQIYTSSGGFMGLSFAIPSDIATNVIEQLRQTGKVTRGWLGVSIQNVNKDIAQSFGLEKPHGALVAEVMQKSAAEKYGIENGDIITHFDGKEVLFSSDLPAIVGNSQPGKEYKVDLVRNKKTKTIKVVLSNREARDEIAAATSAPVYIDLLAVKVRNLTSEERTKLGLADKEQGGVLLTHIKQGLGAEIGLHIGLVITELNNQEITSVRVLREVIDKLQPNSTVSMRVISNGNPRFLAFRLPNK